jgi:quercetin dioxygenase-like cupin family protein
MTDEADKSAVGLDAKTILKVNQTVAGGPLKYPNNGKAEITSLIVTIQPGGHTNLHQHPVVTFVYVLEGEAELRVGDKSFRYKSGDSWVEPIDTPNQLFNLGSVPVKNLVVFVGSEGNPNSVALK